MSLDPRSRTVAALAVFVLVGSAALFVHSSCTPSGATKTPDQTTQPDGGEPDPDPQSVDLSPPRSRLPPGAVT